MSRRGDPSAYQRDEAGGAKRLGHALPPRILSATGSRRTDYHASVAQPHKDASANRVGYEGQAESPRALSHLAVPATRRRQRMLDTATLLREMSAYAG